MVYILMMITILAVDIVTKIFAAKNLLQVGTVPLWKDVFHLTYVENRGAAFGVFQNGRIFFIAVTVLVIALAIFAVYKYYKNSKLPKTAITFIISGATGNLLDRVFRGFVVDFLDFRLINFPVFNVADIFVVIGAALFAIFIIFFDEAPKKKE